MKKILRRMSEMCDEAWYIFIGTLKLSCVMLFCAFILLSDNEASYFNSMLASALYETPQGLLMLSLLFSLFIEERHG